MDFQWPLLLWTLASVPVLIGLYVLAQRRRYRHAARFTNVDLLADVVPSTPGWRRHVPVALFLLALTALLVSLARPEAVIQVPKEQATVVMVIDVSGSMNATDVFPTRMDSAREAAGSFLEIVPEQFRIGLVTFSNTAQVVSPPTTDRDMVLAGLNSMRARGGTAMGDGIDQALTLSAPDLQQPPAAPGTEPEAEDGEEPPPRVILLVSDGYNTAGRSPLEVALEAQEEDVTIFTVALGTQEGTVEVPGPGGVPRIIAVPPDEATLERIASMTDGSFFTAPTDNDLQQVYEALGSQIGYDSENQEVTVVFSAAGAVLMVLGALLSLLWVRSFP